MIKILNDDIQPQNIRGIYPCLEINIDSSLEWRGLKGDKEYKYDSIEKINESKCKELKQQILDDQEIVNRARVQLIRLKKYFNDWEPTTHTGREKMKIESEIRLLKFILGEK